MSGDGSLGYWSQDTSHSPYHHCNNNDISNDESLGVSVGDIKRGFRSQETSHYSSRNCVVYRHGDQSCDDGRGGYMYQYTIHYSSLNSGARVDFYRRGG